MKTIVFNYFLQEDCAGVNFFIFYMLWNCFCKVRISRLIDLWFFVLSGLLALEPTLWAEPAMAGEVPALQVVPSFHSQLFGPRNHVEETLHSLCEPAPLETSQGMYAQQAKQNPWLRVSILVLCYWIAGNFICANFHYKPQMLRTRFRCVYFSFCNEYEYITEDHNCAHCSKRV